MKLWILSRNCHNWDEYDSMVVRSKTAKEARILAAKKDSFNPDFWLDPKKSDCEYLPHKGEAGVLIGSFNAG